jgi:hypothetical protein
MPENKRVQKSLWFPKKRLDWATDYFNQNKESLALLGINDVNELIWRLTDLGTPEMDELVKLIKSRQKKEPKTF